MVYPTLKRRRWPLALLAGGVALTASMMTVPAFAAELPSGGDDDQPLALVNANASESGASAADELAAVAVAGEPQGPAVDMNSGPSTGVGASADPAAEQKTDEKGLDEAGDVQVSGQQQGQAASAKTAAADGVAPVAKTPAPAETGYTGWAVEDRNNGYGLQRYWMVNGKTATSELLDAAETGWWAYARPEGFVVRGRWTDPSTGYVYLANNDGRLEDPGWVVSSSYGQGLQRYWVDAKAHAAVPGYSSDGWDHYTTSSGYVLRGTLRDGSDYYIANNDGKLTASSATDTSTGWWVTSSLGHGLQRYWLNSGKLALSTLIDPALGHGAYWAYARPEGYVVRGRWAAPNGYVYLANNDGRLEDPGWVVSSSYGQGLQRYWVDAKAHAAVPGYSSDGWDHYTTSSGYVLRGRLTAPNGYVYLANNDGRLEGPGWVVSSSYGQGLQRYWIDAKAHAAVPGYSKDGWAHYTTSSGYVLRGVSILGDGTFYRANNDGKVLDSTEGSKDYIGWWVTSSLGHGLQRYWLNSGKLALSTLIDPALGHGAYWAYARPEGFVVRGKWDKGNGHVYVADNDGVLPSVSGWMVTGKYDGGTLQRYYMDGDAHAAVTSFFRVDGNLYYGIGWQGYVLRNSTIAYDGSFYVADNDGVLTKRKYSPLIQSMVDRAQGFSSSTGWLVLVSRSDCHVAVFSGGRGNWNLYDDFACAVGASSSPTITGTYATQSRRPSLDTDSRARYCTQINGGYFFHTILSSNSELGHWTSHGCIRLPVEKARWIYSNLPLWTTVNIY